VSATVTVHVVEQPVHYVALNNSSPLSPYGSWATAATNIQDAVDAASVVGASVLVSNGVYQTGGRAVFGVMTNRVTVDKPLTVRSVNGPAVTVIRGYQVPGTTNGDGAVRCVYLANGAALLGFTLTNGATRSSGDYPHETTGGGVWCESVSTVVSNCTLTGNSAQYSGGGAVYGTLNNCTLTGNTANGQYYGSGGGASGGTLNNCTLTGNSAYDGGGTHQSTLNNCTLTANSARSSGGGAYAGTLNNCTLTSNSAGGYGGGGVFSCTLNNCTLTGNSAQRSGGAAFQGVLNSCTLTGNSAQQEGGGVAYGTLNNCIVYFNNARIGANYYQERYDGILNYCCTTPLPTNGVGNFTSAPLFVDQVGGNLRLQANSLCINSGLNAYAPAGLDLDGNPRILGGTVDAGAYEFQSPASVVSYAWLQQYGLPTNGSVDSSDADGDGLNNWQEWRTGTIPTNALSMLRLLTPTSGAPGVIVRWQSVSARTYFVERGTNLGAQTPFLPLATEIVGQAGTTTYLDTNAVGAGPFFYRVGVLP